MRPIVALDMAVPLLALHDIDLTSMQCMGRAWVAVLHDWLAMSVVYDDV